jgi:glycosyltransferase involved in cell wall biosynthesis
MSMPMPELRLGLPVYNGERFLAQTLEGLRQQTYGDFELVISDNASTDATEQICREQARQDRRIRYERLDRNLGAVANFNRVFTPGAAPYFKWVAHDDAYDARYLATCMDVLTRHPDVVLAHTATAFIDGNGCEFPMDEATGGYIGPWDDDYRHPDGTEIGSSDQIAERFRQVLTGALWGTHMFGVIRSEALQRTQLLANFVSSDRAMLAELALLGRFQASEQRLFRKRFHADVSWALNQQQLKAKLSTSDVSYSRRSRQLRAFLSAPWDKPIGIATKLQCTGLVMMHGLKIVREILARKDAHNEAAVQDWQKSNRGTV